MYHWYRDQPNIKHQTKPLLFIFFVAISLVNHDLHSSSASARNRPKIIKLSFWSFCLDSFSSKIIISLRHHVCDELKPQVLLFCFEITRRPTKVWNFLKLLPYNKGISCIHNREWRKNSWDFSHYHDCGMAVSISNPLNFSKNGLTMSKHRKDCECCPVSQLIVK